MAVNRVNVNHPTTFYTYCLGSIHSSLLMFTLCYFSIFHPQLHQRFSETRAALGSFSATGELCIQPSISMCHRADDGNLPGSNQSAQCNPSLYGGGGAEGWVLDKVSDWQDVCAMYGVYARLCVRVVCVTVCVGGWGCMWVFKCAFVGVCACVLGLQGWGCKLCVSWWLRGGGGIP